MKLFMFAASLQKKSLNKQLIHIAATLIRDAQHTVDYADFNEFNAPLYNADIQQISGFPASVLYFVERLHQADGCIISVPEYNFSIPGVLKNLIDWVSRISPMPWNNQYIQLLSASPSLVGGNRGLWQTRIALESCGTFVFPNMFSLASAHDAFNNETTLKNEMRQQSLIDILNHFLQLLTKLTT